MNCKPGDLAVVIASRTTPEIIGCIVEVVSAAVHGDAFKRTTGNVATQLVHHGMPPAWRVRASRPLPWRFANGNVYEHEEVAVADENLRPVSGLPVDEETRDEVPA